MNSTVEKEMVEEESAIEVVENKNPPLYEKFIGFFVEGCINYISKYVRGREAEQHNE